MKLNSEHIERLCPESNIYNELLNFDGKDILELGCGRAEITRAIATAGKSRRITALEVDEIQHRNHQMIDDLPNVQFRLAGAEAIPFESNNFDIALMFKSLHHVPLELMDTAFAEIHRVLRPGGLLYISEPIFAGDFNDLLKMFHDEQAVRKAAFAATCRAVDSGQFTLQQELFFHSPMHFDHFSDFEQKIIGATHTEHQLSPDLLKQVVKRFESHMTEQGADFSMPIRIDLLCKQK